jgi:hypothetical protein
MSFVPPEVYSPERTTVATVQGDEARRSCVAWPSFPAAPIHDAVLEATMYPTICSFHTSVVVIAEGVVA